jgi:peroxiredoxin
VLESQKETFESYEARVISVNLDEPPRAKAVKAFSGQQGFTFAIVMNKTFESAYDIDKAYQVKGTPTSYLIDESGVIVDAHYGPVDAEGVKASLEKLTAD